MIATSRAPRVRAKNISLVDDLAGTEVIHASLEAKTVSLTCRHVQVQREQTVKISAALTLREMISARAVELVDSAGRSRLLRLSPSGAEALQSIVIRLDEVERSERASRSATADITIHSIAKTSSRLGSVVAIQAAPVNASLRYKTTICLESVRLSTDRLEMVVRIGDSRLLASLDSPTEEALEVFAWGVPTGRLIWYGLLEGMSRLEPVKIVVEDLEQVHEALKEYRQSAKNGVLHG